MTTPPATTMNLTYQLTREDYLAFNKYVVSHLPRARFNSWLATSSWGFIGFAVGMGIFRDDVYLAIGLGIVIAIVMRLMTSVTLRRRILGLPYSPRGILSERTVTISPEGFRETSTVGDGITYWSGVLEVIDDLHYIYVTVDSFAAYIVPKRAFPSAGEAQRFLATATFLWRSANPDSSGA